ncbi:hypothetical protein TNCV_3097251 [Trichonephila clavipes]|uniref:Uncharacterized protein n=1 Tax=Trichonephila clavipes TaxID=2585209 RepID=A0A8X6SPP9_TRICX|nr:hypothetical protein TNCV_3097251 [Trichonephila clavipes]
MEILLYFKCCKFGSGLPVDGFFNAAVSKFFLSHTSETKIIINCTLLSVQGFAQFNQKIQRDDRKQHWTTNNHRTRNRKPRLLGENHDGSSRREDDEPDKGRSQTDMGIWRSVVGLKKLARMQIFHSSGESRRGTTGHCLPERVVHVRRCTSTFFDCDA